MTDKTIGLYIHIPFCKSKCPYCDFYSMRASEGLKTDYKNAVIREIKKHNYLYDTVYFGGGTPSQISSDAIAEILSYVNKSENCEITVECNPSDAGTEKSNFNFITLYNAGVNRISMGLQSAVDSERKALGRISGKKEVSLAIERCRNAGIENLSLDLMAGIPGQTETGLLNSLNYCIDIGVPHISTYLLKIEEGTFFHKNREKLLLPTEDETCDMYLTISEKLRNAEYNHYEISNFAKPGFESRHNLKYWNGLEYLGIGPSAHSFIDGSRFYFDRDINSFIKGCAPVQDGLGGDLEEYIMLRLRLKEGIDFEALDKKYSYSPSPEFLSFAKLLEEKGYADLSPEGLSLTPTGFLISNTIISELIDRL